VVTLYTSQLYTLWEPILYAHGRHLIHVSWPEDGCNAAETCSHELLMHQHLKLCILLLLCLTWIIYTWRWNVFTARYELNL